MKTKRALVTGRLIIFSACCFELSAFSQGAITPSGPPGPTMKTLSQVEPRTAISSLPVTITNSGSYYLTGTLTGISGTNGITIMTNNVTVDLCGFSMLGVNGSGDGINASGPSFVSYTNITILNGTIQGWGGKGIEAADVYSERLEGLLVSSNGSSGLDLGSGSIISHCVAVANGGYGIADNYGGVYEACSAMFNKNDGFHVGGGKVSNCTAYGNNFSGIWAYNGSLVTGCVSRNNALSGIGLGVDSVALGNDCSGNNGAANSGHAGIYQFYGPGRIEGNHISYYTGVGIRVAAGQTQIVVVRNTTAGNTNNAYSIPAGNDVGPWGQAATATSPWANIQN